MRTCLPEAFIRDKDTSDYIPQMKCNRMWLSLTPAPAYKSSCVPCLHMISSIDVTATELAITISIPHGRAGLASFTQFIGQSIGSKYLVKRYDMA